MKAFFRNFSLMIVLGVMVATATAQVAAPVQPQPPRDDGSVVHTVRFGDTFQGILLAYSNYGITIDSLVTLNEWRFQPDAIYVDEEIVILPPGSVDPATGELLISPANLTEATAPPPQTDATVAPAATQAQTTAADTVQVLSAAEISAISPIDEIGQWVAPAATPDETAIEAMPAEPTSVRQSVFFGSPIEPVALPEVMSATESSEPDATEATEVAAVETEVPATAEVTPSIVPTETMPPTEVAVEPTATEPEPTTASTDAPTESLPTETPRPVVPEMTEVPTEVAEVVVPEPTAMDAAEIAPEIVQQTGVVCVSLFDDRNQNGYFDPDEALLAGGQVMVDDMASDVNEQPEPLCMPDLVPGTVQVVATPPEGFALTGSGELQVVVYPGRTSDARFGAAEGIEAMSLPPRIDEELAAPFVVPVSSVDVDAGDDDILDTLFDSSAFIALGLAVLAAIFGGGLLFVLRPR